MDRIVRINLFVASCILFTTFYGTHTHKHMDLCSILITNYPIASSTLFCFEKIYGERAVSFPRGKVRTAGGRSLCEQRTCPTMHTHLAHASLNNCFPICACALVHTRKQQQQSQAGQSQTNNLNSPVHTACCTQRMEKWSRATCTRISRRDPSPSHQSRAAAGKMGERHFLSIGYGARWLVGLMT